MSRSVSKTKKRLDHLLVDLGYADNGSRAQALIRAGEVLVDGEKVDKPGTMVSPEAIIRILRKTEDVSRGAAKLRAALTRFPISVEGKRAADLGSSTGGFTQVLLEKGASRVDCFDVGYGLLHERLEKDPRVVVHDRTNVRYLTGEELEHPAQVVVMDLSFIGIRKVLPAVFRISVPEMEGLSLIKPQFEAGRSRVGKGGIVRERSTFIEVLENHLDHLKAEGFVCWGLVPCAVKGKKGNQEFFSWFRKAEVYGPPPDPVDVKKVVE